MHMLLQLLLIFLFLLIIGLILYYIFINGSYKRFPNDVPFDPEQYKDNEPDKQIIEESATTDNEEKQIEEKAEVKEKTAPPPEKKVENKPAEEKKEQPKKEDMEKPKPAVKKQSKTESIKKSEKENVLNLTEAKVATDKKPDNLTKIKGIGKVIEEKLNKLNIYHFEQIACWTQKDIEMVDKHLSFTGRIIREQWVEQAKILAKGEETEFSKRVEKGEVPSSSKD